MKRRKITRLEKVIATIVFMAMVIAIMYMYFSGTFLAGYIVVRKIIYLVLIAIAIRSIAIILADYK